MVDSKILYRVETSGRSSYFAKHEHASNHFTKQRLANKDCELWEIVTRYSPQNKRFFAEQTLLNYHTKLENKTIKSLLTAK